MTATAAEALELALWLHRAPARRAALMGRPLPDGIGQLLRVAGGAPDQVAAAARITGEDEATILEAVRFYLQQILFHDGADAYRVLGLRPDADQAQAREHHRLLQSWLHPDRRGQDQWESAYATKVNRAWTQLRTPQSRAAYDASLASATAAAGSHYGGERPAVVSEAALRPQPPARHHSRNLTLLVLLGCAGLLLLITMRTEEPPQWQDDRASGPTTPPQASPDIPDGSVLAATLDALAAETAAHVESAAAAIAKPVSRMADAGPVPEATPPPRPATSHAVAAPMPRSPAAPLPTRRAAPSAADARQPGPESEPAALRPLPATTAAREPDPAPMQAVQAAAVAPTLAPAPPVVARIPATQPIPDALARMRQARARAGQVLDYLGDPRVVQPPVWNDLATAQAAARLRTELQARFPSGAKLGLHDPQWRLSPDGARLESSYRAEARGGRGEAGRLTLDFVWREDRLLVRALSMAPQ